MNWEYEAKRNAKLLKAVKDRLKCLDGYTCDNDTHRGVRLAVSLIRSDLNTVARNTPKKPKPS
jgi:hypothetical protein